MVFIARQKLGLGERKRPFESFAQRMDHEKEESKVRASVYLQRGKRL